MHTSLGGSHFLPDFAIFLNPSIIDFFNIISLVVEGKMHVYLYTFAKFPFLFSRSPNDFHLIEYRVHRSITHPMNM